ncbi:hypothetical protein [Bradyrhizobium yuanmingense]|nr:hypothetical protein [Bradyrhizobium yuanmingense]
MINVVCIEQPQASDGDAQHETLRWIGRVKRDVPVEIAQHAYAGTPSLTEAEATCGVPAVPDPSSNWAIRKDLTPTSPTLLDNYWQVWQNQSDPTQYAIAVRGTVESEASVLADLLFPLINARFDVKLGPISLPSYLVRDEVTVR